MIANPVVYAAFEAGRSLLCNVTAPVELDLKSILHPVFDKATCVRCYISCCGGHQTVELVNGCAL